MATGEKKKRNLKGKHKEGRESAARKHRKGESPEGLGTDDSLHKEEGGVNGHN